VDPQKLLGFFTTVQAGGVPEEDEMAEMADFFRRFMQGDDLRAERREMWERFAVLCVVELIYEWGFTQNEAVGRLSEVLPVSERTIYRYLKAHPDDLDREWKRRIEAEHAADALDDWIADH
jgi:hypothetical protein